MLNVVATLGGVSVNEWQTYLAAFAALLGGVRRALGWIVLCDDDVGRAERHVLYTLVGS